MATRFMLTNGWIEGHGLLVGPVTNLRSGNLRVPGGKGGLRIEGILHDLGTIHIDADAESAGGLQVQGHLLHRGRRTFGLAGEGPMLQPLLSVAGSLTLPGDGGMLGVTRPAGFRPGWTNAVLLIQWGGRIGRLTNAYAGAWLTVGGGQLPRALGVDPRLRGFSSCCALRAWARSPSSMHPVAVPALAATFLGECRNTDGPAGGRAPHDR